MKIYLPISKELLYFGEEQEGKNGAFSSPIFNNNKNIGTFLLRKATQEQVFRFIALERDAIIHPHLNIKWGEKDEKNQVSVFTESLDSFVEAFNTINIIPS